MNSLATSAWLIAALLLPACSDAAPRDERTRFTKSARHMIEEQLIARGISDERVLAAMQAVPRHEFVPPELRDRAYDDRPLPIGYDQTISQPYIVAFMSEALKLQPTDRVLEVGTGSGYQAAVLGMLAREVYSIEIVEPLAGRAAADLKRLGYSNIHVRAGDGYLGWPEAAPFDAVIVTCAPDHIPAPFVQQLKDGGRMIIPVGDRNGQRLIVLEKHGSKIEQRAVLPVMFVPMTGESEKRAQ